MPSWNIHIAHAEHLLARDTSLARVVQDRNAFLFGNLVPDIYVGYMVPGIVHPVPYRITHFATPEHIPKPRADEFWEAHVAPLAQALQELCPSPTGEDAPLNAWRQAPASLAEEVLRTTPVHTAHYVWESDVRGTQKLQAKALEPACGPANPVQQARSRFDMTLGAWVHLLADRIWNQRVSDLLNARDGVPSRGFRVKKQTDFDLFGKSLSIDSFPRATPQLIEVARDFPQYPIDERAVVCTEAVAHEIVRTNFLDCDPAYQMLDGEFFAHVFSEVNDRACLLASQRLKIGDDRAGA